MVLGYWSEFSRVERARWDVISKKRTWKPLQLVLVCLDGSSFCAWCPGDGLGNRLQQGSQRIRASHLQLRGTSLLSVLYRFYLTALHVLGMAWEMTQRRGHFKSHLIHLVVFLLDLVTAENSCPLGFSRGALPREQKVGSWTLGGVGIGSA